MENVSKMLPILQ